MGRLKDRRILVALVIGLFFAVGQLWLIEVVSIETVVLSVILSVILVMYYFLTHWIVTLISKYPMWKQVIFVILIALFGYFFRISSTQNVSIFDGFVIASFSVTVLYWIVLVSYIIFITFTSIIQFSKLVDSLNNFLLPLMGTLTAYPLIPFSKEAALLFAVMTITAITVFCVIDYRSAYHQN